MNAKLSPEKAIEIARTIYQIETNIENQKYLAELFNLG